MRTHTVTLSLLMLLSGCAVGPDYHPLEIDTGQGWVAPNANATDVESSADLEQWWRRFDDPTLDRLVETALIENLDIREADERIAEARALRDAAGGGRRPVVNVSAGVTRRRQSENGPFPINQIPGLDRDQTIYEPAFDAAWEIDASGRMQRAVEAANARLDARAAEARGTEIRVAAETARAYFELRGAQHEQAALESAVIASRASTELVRQQLAAGEVPESALAKAEASLANVEAQLPVLETRVRAAALSLGILLGNLPESEIDLAESSAAYVTLMPLPVGQRADLLRRRPDISAAERRVAAATADVGVATAELFPKIRIGANGGFQSLETGTLLESASETFALAPLISWRIFDGGRVRAEIRASEARVRIAALEYEKAVKDALTDAELALTRYNLGLVALDRQDAAVTAARRSYEFADDRYRAGDISLLELLDAERSLRGAESTYAETHTRAATALVALFKALGGGWRVDADAA
jgi:NodT family efflux transporter outer membrane factor (OMF) lipoprotein